MRVPAPLLFALLGPPAGAAAAVITLLLGQAAAGGVPPVVWRHLDGLVAAALLACWPLGGAQAALVGAVAARDAARTGRVRLLPPLAAALALAVPTTLLLAVLPPFANQLPLPGLAILVAAAQIAGTFAAWGAWRLLRRPPSPG